VTGSELGTGRQPRAWFPAPALQATAALHLGGAVGLALGHPEWRWIAGTLVANHGLLFAATMAPRSRILGPNVVRLPKDSAGRREVALTFDDGPDPEVTPRVLDQLDRHGAVGSFFCIGAHVARHPKLAREIVARGHAVESHSYRHALGFAGWGPRRLEREVEESQRAIEDATGVTPVFFRSPYGTRSPMLDRVLARAGLSYVSWQRRGFDAVDPSPERVLRRLTRRLEPRDVLLLHDGVSGRRLTARPTVLDVLPRLLRFISAQGFRPVSLRAAFGAARA
jgi:peptidoglycan/xylan/chitin deacetylase (PgdA/CDA1 family)